MKHVRSSLPVASRTDLVTMITSYYSVHRVIKPSAMEDYLGRFTKTAYGANEFRPLQVQTLGPARIARLSQPSLSWRRQHRPSARTARRAGGTIRDRRHQRRRGQRARAARAPVSVLRRSHDHHRDIRARRLAALSAGGIRRRDQDRHVMIKVGARQNYRAASVLRRISTGNDQARPRAARDSRRVVRSRAGDTGSADRNRLTGFVTPSIASHTSVQQTPVTDRRR
jgi:hypothetical protein